MQYETCRQIKEDGACCGSPALRDNKYCYYHLRCRGRRLRRARALRDNIPYRLDLPPLEDLAAVQVALSETVHALGAGQLDHRTAGKMLCHAAAISIMKFRLRLQAAQSEANEQAGTPHKPGFGLCVSFPQNNDRSDVQEYPQFQQEFGIKPGTDIDAEIHQAFQEAEEQGSSRALSPSGNCAAFVPPENGKYSLADANQMLQGEVRYLEQQLWEYRRKEREQHKMEAQFATPLPASKPEPGPAQSTMRKESPSKKPSAPTYAPVTEKAGIKTA